MQAQKSNQKATTAPQKVDVIGIRSVYGEPLEVVKCYNATGPAIEEGDIKKLTRFSDWREHSYDEGKEKLLIRNGRTDVTTEDGHFVKRTVGTLVAGFLRGNEGKCNVTVEPVPDHLKEHIADAIKRTYRGVVLFGQELPTEF